MSDVLLVDPSPLCRELLAKTLDGQGFSVVGAPSASDAIRVLGASDPRVIILEPGASHEGVQFLQALRKAPKWRSLPVIVLAEQVDKPTILHAAQLGVHDFILKSRFSLSDLLTRIGKYVRAVQGPAVSESSSSAQRISEQCSAHGVPTTADTAQSHPTRAIPRLTRDQTLQRMESADQPKTLAGAMAEVMALVNSPRGAISDVAKAVKRDPVLSARILQLANSAAFASQKPRIATIDEAVRNIGVSGVRNMALAVGIFDTLSTSTADLAEMLRMWQHLFAVGSIMERIVPVSDAVPPGVAQLAGLSHDLPQMVLQQHFTQEYAALAELANQSGRSIPEVALDVFGIPFPELATLCLGKLGLPPLIISTIREFFERGIRFQSSEPGSLVARGLRLANILAHGMMLAPSSAVPVTPISASECRNLFGESRPPKLDVQTLWSETVMTVNMLANAPSGVTREISQPLIRPSALKIWYWRHPLYSDLDPLEILLSFGGQVKVHPSLPKSEQELSGYDLLLAASCRQDNQTLAQTHVAEIGKLVNHRPLPVLYLSGVEPSSLTGLPPGSCLKLPISIAQIIELFARCKQGPNAERGFHQSGLCGKAR